MVWKSLAKERERSGCCGSLVSVIDAVIALNRRSVWCEDRVDG